MNKLVALGVVVLLTASMAQAAPSVAYPSMSVTQLTGTDLYSYTSFGGLTKAGNTLYFGNNDTILSYDLGTSTAASFAACGNNAGIGTINTLGGNVYMSKDTSYSSPFPSNFGTIDSVNGFVATMPSGAGIGATTYSIYDSAVYNGNLYFVAVVGSYVEDGLDANTDPDGVTYGTSIFQYVESDPTNPVEIATIGGPCGGLTFDAAGNLYYASQNANEGVLKFTAADVATGNLTAVDGETVVNITGGSLAFLSDGTLVAETGWGQTLAAYDVATGDKLYDIATTSGSDYMGKFVVGADDTIYVLSNDWDAIYDVGDFGGDGAVLSAITVPEPTTLGLLILGGAAMLKRRRN